MRVDKGDKVRPGLATCAGDHAAAADQLMSLFKSGAELVPLAERSNARAIIRGTGGIRDELDEASSTALLDALYLR